MHRWLVIVALALLSLPRSAAADTVRVAIVPFGANIEELKVDQLAQDMAQGLESVLDIEVVAGLDVRREIQDLSQNCVNEPPCPAQLAGKLKVQQILFVVFIDVGGALQVDTKWADATNKTVQRSAIDIPAADQAKQKFADAAKKLLPDAPVRKGAPPPGTGRMSDPVPRHMTTPAYVTAAAGIVGLGVGVGFGLRTRSKYNDCDVKACTQSQHDSIRVSGLVADAGFLIGLGGAVATTILFMTSGEESHLVIEGSPQAGGATVSARFRF